MNSLTLPTSSTEPTGDSIPSTNGMIIQSGQALQNHHVVGTVAYRYTRMELSEILEDDPFPGCFCVLSGFTNQQLLSFVQSATADITIADRLVIELPKSIFEGLLPDHHLVDHSAVATRLAPRDGKIRMTAAFGQDELGSLGHKKEISANTLKQAPAVWYEVISKEAGLNLVEEQEKQVKAMIKGVFDSGNFNIAMVADYIRLVTESVKAGNRLVIATGLHLPTLGLPKYEDCFKSIPEKRLGHSSQWCDKFDQHQRQACYLSRRDTSGLLIPPEKLIDKHSKLKAELEAGTIVISPDALQAFSEYAKAPPENLHNCKNLFFNHDWACVKDFFERGQKKSTTKKFIEKTLEALNYNGLSPTDTDQAILVGLKQNNSRKTGCANESESEFYKSYADAIAAFDPNLAADWEDFVYEKKATCTDLIQGILECVRRRLPQITPGYKATVVVEGVRQSTPADFDGASPVACEYFQWQYGNLAHHSGGFIEFSKDGKKKTLLPNYRENVREVLKAKPKKKKPKRAKKAKGFEFRIAIFQAPIDNPSQKAPVCTIPLTWDFLSDSVLSKELDDLEAMLKHASKKGKSITVIGRANYETVGKKGNPLTISLSNVYGFAPTPGEHGAGSFIPKPSVIKTVRDELDAVINMAIDRIWVTPEFHAKFRTKFQQFEELYTAVIRSYASDAFDVSGVPEMVEAYKELHQIAAQVMRAQTRKSILKELLGLGTVTVEATAHRPTLSIICPWHPLRLEANRGRLIQIQNTLEQVLKPCTNHFSDGRKGNLFFKDLNEALESPLQPEIAVSWREAEAHPMVETQSIGNYTLHEHPNDPHQTRAVEDNATQATQTILHELDEYLRLQPHERDNLSILLYNCDSRELPAKLVAALNKRNRDPKSQKVSCEILLTHRKQEHLQEIYQNLVADSDNEEAKPDETTGDFLSRVRINITASSLLRVTPKSRRSQPADIAYCRDLLSKEANLKWDWVGRQNKTLPAESIAPHQWQRMAAFRDGDSAVKVLLTCPAQTEAGWNYLRNVGFVCEHNTDKAWEAGQCAVPMRVLNFDSKQVAEILHDTHSLGVWVVNQDELLDRRLLENREVKVIRYVQSTTQGRNLVISSTARDTLLVNTLKERLRILLTTDIPEETICQLVSRFMSEANLISGGLILKAARRANNTSELLGMVLSKYLVQSQLGSGRDACWCFLDDCAHWLGKKEGSGMADLLVLAPTEKNGRPHLDIIVTEAKFVIPEGLAEAKSRSEKQLLDTLNQISHALKSDPRPLDQELWLARISDMILSRSTGSVIGKKFDAEQWRSIIRNRECTFSISGYSHVFLHIATDVAVSTCKGIETSETSKALPAFQEVFNSELTRKLILQMHANQPDQTLQERNRLGHPSFETTTVRDISNPKKAPLPEPRTNSETQTPAAHVTGTQPPEAGFLPTPHTNVDSIPSSLLVEIKATSGQEDAQSVLSFLTERASAQTHNQEQGLAWLAETVNQLRTALHSRGMSAKIAENKPPILTPNAALIRLQGGADLTIKSIESRMSDLLTSDGLRILALYPGERHIAVSIARPDRQIPRSSSVFVKLLEEPRAEGDERVFIGIKEEDGRPMFMDPFSNPHTLVAGATGSGKSVLVQNMLIYLALTRTPDQSHLYLIDGKHGVDYLPLHDLPHVQNGSKGIVDTKEGSARILEQLVEEMESRYALFKKARAKDIRHYRSKTGEYLPTLWVIHDEFAEWMHDKDYADAITANVDRLSIKSRAAGIFMMFCAQRPDNTVMPMQLRSQLGNRLVLRVSDPGTAEISTGEKNSRAEQLLKHGHMLAKVESEMVYVQVPNLDTDSETAPLVHLICKQYSSHPSTKPDSQ